MRGGERVLHELAALYPSADLFTLFHVPGATSDEIEKLRLHVSPLSSLPGSQQHYRKLLPFFPWAIRRFDFTGYDLVISCSHAVAKSIRKPRETAHLSYCLTPMRYVWDQIDGYLGDGLFRAAAAPLASALRHFDRRTSGPNTVTRFAAISTGVQQRIKTHYARTASRVYPPVQVDRFRLSGKPAGDEYLLVGGFVPYKCDELAVRACEKLGRQLIVVGDGPGRRRLERSTGENVRFLGRVGDAQLAELYANCRALLYPQDEDFGIAAVEAQAAGRPVIAYARGGALDTVRPHPASPIASLASADASSATGIHFPHQSIEGVIAAIECFEANEDQFDAEAIRRWAEGFAVDRFRREFLHEVELTLEDHRAHLLATG